MEGSHASPSARMGTGESLRTSGGCGLSSPVPFASFDPASSSLRMSQTSLFGDSTSSCLTLPRSGLMRSGRCYQLPPWVPRTAEIGCSSWPTPTASDAKRVTDFSRETLEKVFASRRPGNCYLAEVLVGDYGVGLTPEFSEWLMGIPIGWTSVDSAPSATPLCPK